MVDVIAMLRRDGFALVKEFLSIEERASLAAGCQELAQRVVEREPADTTFQERHKSTSHTFVNKHELASQLELFASSRKIRRIAGSIFNDNALFHMSLLQHNEPGKGQGLAWHRDVLFEFGAMQMVNLLFYPLGTDQLKGGVRVLPGSQSISDVEISDSFAQVSGERELYPAAQDLLIVDGACFHAVSGNKSREDRIALNLRFRHSRAPEEVTRYGEYPTGTVDYLN